MKSKFHFLFCLLVLGAHKMAVGQGYIKLNFNGDQSKPYPRIILFTAGTVIDSLDKISLTHSLLVSKESFEKIKMSLFQSTKVNRDSILIDSYSYRISIIANHESLIFSTSYLSKIRQLFYTIINQMSNKEEDSLVKGELQNTLTRLKYVSKFL